MRKLLFYTWCFGGVALYGWLCRWMINTITDNYGVAAMAGFTVLYVGACWLIARRIDKADAIAAQRLTGYRWEQEQYRAASGHSRPEDDSTELLHLERPRR